MSLPQPHRRGTAIRDSFIYMKDDGTFNTGLTQADFTIKLSKDGVGNQSTTGVTLTEVDSTNNPGQYDIAIATTGFVGVNGTYTLAFSKTSDVRFSWEQTWEINETGTPLATPASFTATAADGRVTDGASPLENADVYLTVGTTFIGSTITDALGLWGPIYLPDGTITIRVQKSGYNQGSGNITVSGTTVTGPGADIALAVGSTVDPMAAAQLWAYARRQAVDQTGTKADTIIKSAVNDALDMISGAKPWPHLLRRAYLTLKGAYTTGTITTAAGDATVTLAGGTLPAWAASGRIFFQGQVIDVASRTDDTHLEMATPWGGTGAAGLTYVLFQNEYDLPDDMWHFHRVLPGQRWGWGPDPVAPGVLFEMENAAIYGQRFANVFAIHNGAIAMAPYPTSDETIAYTYYARPARLTVDTDIADWDPVHLEALKRAIDVQLAIQFGRVVHGDIGACQKDYDSALGRDAAATKESVDIPGVGSGRSYDEHSLDWRRRT